MKEHRIPKSPSKKKAKETPKEKKQRKRVERQEKATGGIPVFRLNLGMTQTRRMNSGGSHG
jgi:hypothetical protein